jgi:hypothetical protein
VAGLFTGGPPATCLTPEFLNSIQEEICGVIESAGIAVATDGYSDTKNQLLAAIRTLLPTSQYDVIVTNQAQFNAIIERIGANHYHIRDSYRSVLLRNTGIGYLCGGSGSFLSGGDTWGYLQTNNCTHFRMENGAYLSDAGTPFYMVPNTDYCKMDNVWIRGDAVTYLGTNEESFYLEANHVTYDNCKVSHRYRNAVGYEFRGSATSAHNYTSKYIGCSVFDCSCDTRTSGFYQCLNLVNCVVHNCFTLSALADVYGFDDCDTMSGCTASSLSTTTGDVFGFLTCARVTCCYAVNLSSTTGSIYGFNGGSLVTSCHAFNLVSSGAATVIGFGAVTVMSCCYAQTITTVGGIESGFSACSYMSSCYTVEASNPTNDFVNTDDAAVGTNFSCPGTVWT